MSANLEKIRMRMRTSNQQLLPRSHPPQVRSSLAVAAERGNVRRYGDLEWRSPRKLSIVLPSVLAPPCALPLHHPRCRAVVRARWGHLLPGSFSTLLVRLPIDLLWREFWLSSNAPCRTSPMLE